MESELKNKHKSAFDELNDIGVIWVMDEAIKLGYYNGNPVWVNLGQGEPETGEIKGAPPRITSFKIQACDNKYGPINGMLALRSVIAEYYNRLYRKNKESLYKAENVSLAMGGRLALTRIFSILGKIRLGYKIPEYPAYADLMKAHRHNITPICIPSEKENNYVLPSSDFSEAIKENNLDAFLLSNPCNPTGHVIQGEELNSYIKISKEEDCALIIDEVYSHFIYKNGQAAEFPVSSAQFIEDVNSDQVLIVDALTKSFRYPGWRLAWILGPKNIIEDLSRSGGGIDGGPSLPIQRAALQLFETKRVNKETKALRKVFSKKQNIMLHVLRENGMICSNDSSSTFYIWADISLLPNPLNDSLTFFNEALKHKVMTVPGYLFDIRPDKEKESPNFKQFIRFSFGPEEKDIFKGLERITTLIQSY
ncbi:MAG: pyridoxal phosphate-dependent aminotransferase [Bacteroidota bacterium]